MIFKVPSNPSHSVILSFYNMQTKLYKIEFSHHLMTDSELVPEQ